MLEHLILMERREKAKVAGSSQASWSIESHEIDSNFILFSFFFFPGIWQHPKSQKQNASIQRRKGKP